MGQVFICSLLGGESSVDLLVKLGSPAVKFVILRPLAEHVLALSYGYTVRRKTQQDIRSSSQSPLTDEEEINDPVACFCIQSGSLESMMGRWRQRAHSHGQIVPPLAAAFSARCWTRARTTSARRLCWSNHEGLCG